MVAMLLVMHSEDVSKLLPHMWCELRPWLEIWLLTLKNGSLSSLMTPPRE